MTDRFAEVRDLEGQLVAKIVEYDAAPWRLLRNRRLKQEMLGLQGLIDAAMEKADGR
jgi:hypothetical protein